MRCPACGYDQQLTLQFSDPRGLPLFDENLRDLAADAAEDALDQWQPEPWALELCHPSETPNPRTAEARERRDARIREIKARAADKAAGK
jgi:hypothetical protein